MAQGVTVFRGYLGAASAALGSAVPATKKWMITDITITNTDTTARTVTIALDGIELIDAQSVGARGAAGALLQWTGHQNLDAGKTITGFAAVAAKLACHITAVEV